MSGSPSARELFGMVDKAAQERAEQEAARLAAMQHGERMDLQVQQRAGDLEAGRTHYKKLILNQCVDQYERSYGLRVEGKSQVGYGTVHFGRNSIQKYAEIISEYSDPARGWTDPERVHKDMTDISAGFVLEALEHNDWRNALPVIAAGRIMGDELVGYALEKQTRLDENDTFEDHKGRKRPAATGADPGKMLDTYRFATALKSMVETGQIEAVPTALEDRISGTDLLSWGERTEKAIEVMKRGMTVRRAYANGIATYYTLANPQAPHGIDDVNMPAAARKRLEKLERKNFRPQTGGSDHRYVWLSHNSYGPLDIRQISDYPEAMRKHTEMFLNTYPDANGKDKILAEATAHMLGFARAAMENNDASNAAKSLNLAKFGLDSGKVSRTFARPVGRLMNGFEGYDPVAGREVNVAADTERATQIIAAFRNGWEAAEKYKPTDEKLPKDRY